MTKRAKSSGSRPSMQNVAAYAGVSTATVSKVLQGVPTIRAANVERVQNAIEALGYRINPLAAELRRGSRRLVGTIVPSFEKPFFGRLLTALERNAEMRGYALAATSSRGSESREADLINRMSDWRVAGVIVAPISGDNGPAGILLEEFGLPAVFVDRVSAHAKFDTVSADYKHAIEEVGRKYASVADGHVLLLHRKEPGTSADLDVARIKRLMIGSNKRVKLESLDCSGTPPAFAQALEAVLDRTHRPRGVLALSPIALPIVIDEATRRGWKIPNDLCVVAFEAADWLKMLNPGIITIAPSPDNIAAKAVELLFKRLDRPTEAPVSALQACEIDLGSTFSPGLMRLEDLPVTD